MIKFPVANMSELTKMEAGIGFTSGILVGAISSFVLIMFFTAWQWYFKVFSAIGSLGIIGSIYMTLSEQIKMRRNYLAVLKEMEKDKTNLNLPLYPQKEEN